jgi:hypothetical protein
MAQVAALDRQAQDRGFDVLISPERAPDIAAFASVLAVRDRAALETLAAASPFDISPPTDRRPFFFNQLRLTDPLHVLGVMRGGGDAGVMGHVRATVNLYVILAFSTLMAVLVILVPLRRELAALPGGYVAAGTAWFFLIGLGFMLFEMALLQRMSIFLGHPSYSLGILLFSLILSTGLGSFLSERIDLLRGARKYLWAAAVAAVALAGMAASDALFAMHAQADLLLRAALCVGVIVPLGLLLGFGFPTGMAMVRRIDERPSAWFWGINGVAGVSGCALAIVLNIALGIDKTMIAGALCYLLLVIPAWALDRRLR